MRVAPRRVLARRAMPSDGDCLYHAVAATAPPSRGRRRHDAASLRALAADRIEAWADVPDFASGLTLRRWVALHADDGRARDAVAAHVAGVRAGAWGGALELAVLARALATKIVVHQRTAHGVAPIATFGTPTRHASCHVLREGNHYDALVPS